MTPGQPYQVLSDCPHCHTEAAVVELMDPVHPACHLGMPANRHCRMCAWHERAIDEPRCRLHLAPEVEDDPGRTEVSRISGRVRAGQGLVARYPPLTEPGEEPLVMPRQCLGEPDEVQCTSLVSLPAIEPCVRQRWKRHLGVLQLRGQSLRIVFAAEKGNWGPGLGDDLVVFESVPAQPSRIGPKQHLGRFAAKIQVAGDHKTVSAVVPGPANNLKGGGKTAGIGGVDFCENLGRAQGGILHQDNSRYAVLMDGPPVQLAVGELMFFKNNAAFL